jgi:hypothetical protein
VDDVAGVETEASAGVGFIALGKPRPDTLGFSGALVGELVAKGLDVAGGKENAALLVLGAGACLKNGLFVVAGFEAPPKGVELAAGVEPNGGAEGADVEPKGGADDSEG